MLPTARYEAFRQLAGEREWAGGSQKRKGPGGGGSRLCSREPSPSGWDPLPGGRHPPPGVLRAGGGAGFVSILKTRARAAGSGLSFPGGARSAESGQLSALCRGPSSRSSLAVGKNRLVGFSAFGDTWNGERGEFLGRELLCWNLNFQEAVFVCSRALAPRVRERLRATC